MPEQPPVELVALLEDLGLASGAQVAKMGRRVRRLARDLPQFESVWVDALSQARLLTPFQAAEINAGRGAALQVGPYVLFERLAHPYYVNCCRARRIASKEFVRLAVIENGDSRTGEILRQMEGLVAGTNCAHPKGEGPGVALKPVPAPPVPRPSSPAACPTSLFSPITEVGTDGTRIFAAEPWVGGRTAAQWMVHHGRFPPEVVLEIARAMVAQLLELHRVGICHGDVSVSSLMLADSGDVVLVLPGLRGILRPEEGYAQADLAPEAFDSLAPERVAMGNRPDVRSDLYACGCVWWHLLCGRPPLVGGNSIAKLRAAQMGEICDVRRYAPDVPPPLAAAITACLERDPSRRPESIARLAAMLGPLTRGGRDALRDCLARAGRPMVRWTTTVQAIRRSRRTPLWLAGAVCCAAVVVAALWPVLQGRSLRGTLAATPPPIDSTSDAASRSKSHPQARYPGMGIHEDPAARPTPAALASADNEPELVSPPEVLPTAYQAVEEKPQDLVLSDDQPVDSTSLELQAGQCVRGAPGHRAVVQVPRAGIVVNKENIRFENIDFVWRAMSAGNGVNSEEPVVVRLQAGQAEFRGCSFRCEASESDAPAAVRWEHPAGSHDSDLTLPNGALRMIDCLLQGVDVGLDCHTVGALAIEFGNTLHIEGGPLVRLDHFPQSDEPTSITLSQVTLRDTGPMLECCGLQVKRQPGEILLQATACAFVPAARVPLIHLLDADGQAAEWPSSLCDRLLAAIRWTGQGSLVAPGAPIVAWTGPDGRPQDMEESSLSMAGLVRSEVGFAGRASRDPATSRLTRWQAPLQSADAPGIDPARLPP